MVVMVPSFFGFHCVSSPTFCQRVSQGSASAFIFSCFRLSASSPLILLALTSGLSLCFAFLIAPAALSFQYSACSHILTAFLIPFVIFSASFLALFSE